MFMLQSTSRSEDIKASASGISLRTFLHTRDKASILDELNFINDAISQILANNRQAFETNHGKVAYITYCTPSYYFGLLGLARSLRRFSKIPLICLIDGEFETSLIDLENVFFVRVPRLINASYQPGRQEFSNVLSKLWAFGLTPLNKIVFLDADLCILKPIDELFGCKSPAFAPDYVDHLHTQRFNSGVFVFQPSTNEFCQILNSADTSDSYDGGDQGILNNYFAGRHYWLPRTYNTIRHAAYYQNNVMLSAEDIAIIHFIVKKPWEIKYREACDSFLIDLESKWTETLTRNDLLKLISYWRKEIFILYEREMLQSDRKRLKGMNRAIRASIGINALGFIAITLLYFFIN
jgi:hypothetical protein